MSKEHYFYDFSAGVVRGLDYLGDLENIASDIEEDAAGENGDELMNNREARVKTAMRRLDEYVDDLFSNAGLDCLNKRAVEIITRMVAEAMITQRDQSWECFEPSGRAETLAESFAEQD
jgi:hypothetical protein